MQIERFGHRVVPYFPIDLRPARRREIAIDAWCDFQSRQRRFDWNRSCSAKGIQQRAAGFPNGQVNHRRGQRFLDRCRTNQRAIAAFVQTATGGVDRDGSDVLQQRHFNLVRLTRLRKFSRAVKMLHALHDRALGRTLNCWETGQLR